MNAEVNRNAREYRTYKRPSWAPPSWLFAPVWSFLYIIIAITFGYVVYRSYFGPLSGVVLLPFALNLFFNVLFTPIQFRLKNNYLAALDIVLVLTTLVWAIVAVYPYYPWVAIANLPYLAWVCFATVLQFTITYLNS